MSPARLAPPHRAQPRQGRLLLLPMFFPGPQAFPATKSPRSDLEDHLEGRRSWATARGVLWWGRGCGSSPQGSARSPFPRIPPVELTWPSGASPEPPPCPEPSKAPLCPWTAGKGAGSSQCHFCHPSAVPVLVGIWLQSSPWLFPGYKKCFLPLLGLGPAL